MGYHQIRRNAPFRPKMTLDRACGSTCDEHVRAFARASGRGRAGVRTCALALVPACVRKFRDYDFEWPSLPISSSLLFDSSPRFNFHGWKMGWHIYGAFKNFKLTLMVLFR